MQLTKDELEEVLEKLESIRGKQTELVTVYIPAGYDVNTVQRQIVRRELYKVYWADSFLFPFP